MRIAVIGAGRMGAIRAEDLISGGAEVTLFNRRDNVAIELAQKLNCSSAKYADLLKLDFDGYVVATATNSHIAILDELIPLGKPILCEKPISLTVEETDFVIAKCKEYGTEIQVGFQRRFDPPISVAANKVSSGQVGTLYAMHMYAHGHQPSTLEFLEGSGSIIAICMFMISISLDGLLRVRLKRSMQHRLYASINNMPSTTMPMSR